MANLILKPSTGGVLKIQNQDGTVDALSVSTAGNLTAAGNTTLSGTANNLGTVASGILGSAVDILRKSGTGQNVWSQTFSTTTAISDNGTFQPTGLLLDVGSITEATDFLVIFNEDRKEESWNQTSGRHVYSINGGSTFPSTLGETMWHFQIGAMAFPASSEYRQIQGVYYVSFSSGNDIQFRLEGKRHGGSNNYFLNYGAAKSSITAIKVSP